MTPEDFLDIDGLRDDPDADPARPPRKFLSVWFQCCHTYGRMNRNAEGTMYEGRCPRCGVRVQALIGPDGTNRRVFRAT